MLIRASRLGGIAVVFGEYLLRSVGVDPVEHTSLAARALSAGAIAFAAAANIRRRQRRRRHRRRRRRAAKFAALALLVGCRRSLLGGAHGASVGAL